MDPLTIAMLAMSAASALGVGKGDTRLQAAASPSGGGTPNPTAGGIGNLLQTMPQTPAQPEQLDTGMLESSGQAPPAMPAPTPDMPTVQTPGEDAAKMKKMQEIGDLLSSIPEALSIAAPLLGLGPEDNRQQPAPTGGSALQNQQAHAFALPKGPNLGELLAALPRMR